MWKRLHAKYQEASILHNNHGESLRTHPLFLSDFNETRIFSTDFWKKSQILTSMKLRPVEAELFHADTRTDWHDEANSRFSKFCKRIQKREIVGLCMVAEALCIRFTVHCLRNTLTITTYLITSVLYLCYRIYHKPVKNIFQPSSQL
jgi:hypothetical protein